MELDTGTEELLATVDDGVAVLTMNRPERRNALTPTMLRALGATLARVEVDDEGGGGGRATIDGRIHRQRLDQRATSGRLFEMPKPTIAMVPGPAAGAGLSLALACDLRYGAERAVLTTAFARVALAGDYGGTWFLTRLVGPAKARELYFLSPRLDASEALGLGLLNAVVPDDQLEAETLAVARRLAAGPRVAYRYMKENLNRAVLGELGECLDMEAAHHIRTGLTEDHREAAAAFVDKREPVFRGR